MDSDITKQTNVVRYSGCTEKQCIQYDDKGKSLYQYGCIKYISENWNLDICVSHSKDKAVIVVNQAGKRRFTYSGHCRCKQTFYPVGISTDSEGMILTSDFNNNKIHILDQDRKFLNFINNCHLQDPCGLCIDTRGNLYLLHNTFIIMPVCVLLCVCVFLHIGVINRL